jgi:nucleoside-diphosphate-sugar epimerase
MTKLILGCGYLGSRVANRWNDAEESVRVVSRSAERGVVADIRDRATLRPELFNDVTTVLFSVGFDRRGGTIHDVYVQGLANVLHACPPSVKQIIYISTTGVYGRGTGEWIDEQSPTQPEREGGKASLAAEELMRSSEWWERSTILRLAGIYGPDRIPRVQDIREGKPITAHEASWLNLIHVDDAAAIIVECARRKIVAETFNVSDGHPIERRDFYREVARLANAPPPTFVEPSPEEAALTRGGDKRISNLHLLEVIRPNFLYPTYREGLTAILSENHQ